MHAVHPTPGRPVGRPFAGPWPVAQRTAMEVEEAVDTSTLAGIATAIHVGDTSKSTTGVARLKNGELVAATQGSVDDVKQKAKEKNIKLKDVIKTLGAGYHCEVTLYIQYGASVEAMGASQGFCPHCQGFLTDRKIKMDGPNRSTKDQVWRSPEYYAGKEIEGKGYPWVFMKIEPENQRKEFKTKAEYDEWFKSRT